MLRVGVVTFPGSNCERETLRAIARVGAEPVEIWHRDNDLKGVDIVVLPGGFSYGDYLRSGAIARFSPIMDAVRAHAAEGGGVVGICNGFQILCEAGLLPGALVRNAGLHYVSRPVDVRIERSDSICTRAYHEGDVIRIPVAHGDGRFVASPEELAAIERGDQVVLRYAGGRMLDADGNPNDATADIAGICNAAGTIVGMMPHPERLADPALGSDAGIGVFQSLVLSPAPAA
jgi:phosphoribosylformylglycinamidine synthase